jgi:hypothetical protein
MRPSVFRLTLAALAASASLLAQAPGRHKRTVSDAEVARVHKSAPVTDTHNDVSSATIAGMDTAAEIRKIYGENTLRLMAAVERAAAPRR